MKVNGKGYDPKKNPKGSGALVPEGVHEFRVADAEEATSQNSGRDMWVFWLEPLVEGVEFRRLPYRIVLDAHDGDQRILQLLDSVGVDPVSIEADVVPGHFVDKVVLAEVRHKEWQGEPRDEIKRICERFSDPVQCSADEPESEPEPERKTPPKSDIPF